MFTFAYSIVRPVDGRALIEKAARVGRPELIRLFTKPTKAGRSAASAEVAALNRSIASLSPVTSALAYSPCERNFCSNAGVVMLGVFTRSSSLRISATSSCTARTSNSIELSMLLSLSWVVSVGTSLTGCSSRTSATEAPENAGKFTNETSFSSTKVRVTRSPSLVCSRGMKPTENLLITPSLSSVYASSPLAVLDIEAVISKPCSVSLPAVTLPIASLCCQNSFTSSTDLIAPGAKASRYEPISAVCP